MSNRNLFAWFNARSQIKRLRQSILAAQAENHLWVNHPNDYRVKDLGYQTIAGQRIKVKRVYETDRKNAPNWLVLDESFIVSPVSVS